MGEAARPVLTTVWVLPRLHRGSVLGAGDEGGGSGPLAPAVAHIWSCDGCWSKSSTTPASCGSLFPFPKQHFQGCKFSSLTEERGKKASFLSPSCCWHTQGGAGQSQADDLTMGTHLPSARLPLPHGSAPGLADGQRCPCALRRLHRVHLHAEPAGRRGERPDRQQDQPRGAGLPPGPSF